MTTRRNRRARRAAKAARGTCCRLCRIREDEGLYGTRHVNQWKRAIRRGYGPILPATPEELTAWGLPLSPERPR